MRVAIYTLGCKVNQYETQAMEQELQRRGHTLVDFESPADAYIINTCSVTAVSDKKSRQMIRRAKSRNPQAVVAACGCYVQTHTPEAQELGIDLIGGTGDRMEFLTLLEQAAEDLNVELRFLTPTADNSAAEQAHLLERETAGGTQAILLLPADRGVLGEAVSAAAGRTALVTVETDMTEWGAEAAVTMDHQALGEALGEAACNGVPTGGTVLLLDSLPGDNGIQERMLAARETLERAGRQVRIYQWSADTASFTDILRIERPGAVVAFEAAVLAEAAEMARSNESFPLLYGCGSTPAIAAALEEGRVTAIAALNVFSAGYLAVNAAAALARHEDWTGVPTVAFSIVRQVNMYDNDNQKLLFPVT